MSSESVRLSNHLILYFFLLLSPSIFPGIRVFSNELALCIRWPKYWNFSLSPSNEYLELISFKIDWFDLLAVQGTLKSSLRHHSAFFMFIGDIWFCRSYFKLGCFNLNSQLAVEQDSSPSKPHLHALNRKEENC